MKVTTENTSLNTRHIPFILEERILFVMAMARRCLTSVGVREPVGVVGEEGEDEGDQWTGDRRDIPGYGRGGVGVRDLNRVAGDIGVGVTGGVVR